MTIEDKVNHFKQEISEFLNQSEDKVRNSVYQQDTILSQVSYQNLSQALSKLEECDQLWRKCLMPAHPNVQMGSSMMPGIGTVLPM